jgi:CHAT domain-containing protein/Flp pilus assembly protein TadD
MRLGAALILALALAIPLLRGMPSAEALSRAIAVYEAGRLQEAEGILQDLLRAPGASTHTLAAAHKLLGNILFVRGDREGAEREYAAALAGFTQLGERAEIANTRSNLARLAESRGRYDEARAIYGEVLASDRADGDAFAQGLTHLALGDVARAEHRASEAGSEYRAALDCVLVAAPGTASRLSPRLRRDALGNVHIALGLLALEEDGPEAARRRFRAALAAFGAAGSASGRARASYQLARLAWHEGRLDEARTAAMGALRAAEESEVPGPEGDIDNLLGLISEDLGQAGQALHWYAQAARRLGTDPAKMGSVLENIGNLQLRAGRLDEAERAFGEARAAGDTARACNGLGLVALRRGRLADAVAFFRAGGEAPQALANLAHACLLAGRLGEADAALARAEQAASRLDPIAQVAVLALRGEILSRQGDRQGAVGAYAAAIHRIEEMRGRLGHQLLKASFLADKGILYDREIALLVSLGRDGEAIAWMERARSRAFLDLLGDQRLSSPSGAQALADRELDLARALPGARSEAERRALSEQHAAVLGRLRALAPEYASQRGVDPISVADIQAALDQDTALVEYHVGDDSVIAGVVTGRSARVVSLPVKPDELAARVEEVRELLGNRRHIVEPGWADRLHTLYQSLWAPIVPALEGRRRVCVVPYGVLHYLSFASLVAKRATASAGEIPFPRFLLDDYTLYYAPSASVLRFAGKKNPGRPGSPHALILADAVTDLHPLPAARVEGKAVAACLPGARLEIGAGATETVLAREGARYDVIHVASHGELDPDDPMRSRILLTRTREDDGALTVAEIFRLRLHAWLVVLSACESGEARGIAGNFPPGDDLIGLTRSFLYAGTPSVVASLWSVDDAATALLMTDFYRALGSEDKAAALRRAQLQLVAAGRAARGGEAMFRAHPSEWAAFILVGDPR